MPRPRDIVMNGITPEAAREAAMKKAVELHSPYSTVSSKARGAKKSAGYAVLYNAPRGGYREIAMEGISDRQTANDIRKLLERAWVLGFIARLTD